MNKPRQTQTRLRTFGAYAREQRILWYRQDKTDPKGIWRTKKGRLLPSNPSAQFPIAVICWTLVGYAGRMVGLLCLLVMSTGLYYVAGTAEFVATILWGSLIRVWVAMVATPFFVFSVVGLWGANRLKRLCNFFGNGKKLRKNIGIAIYPYVF